MNVKVSPEDTIGAPVSMANVEEFRMLRAIAFLALLEAVRDGEYCATFHGYCVHARRDCRANSDELAEVELCVSIGKALVERSIVIISDAGVREPKR